MGDGPSEEEFAALTGVDIIVSARAPVSAHTLHTSHGSCSSSSYKWTAAGHSGGCCLAGCKMRDKSVQGTVLTRISTAGDRRCSLQRQ